MASVEVSPRSEPGCTGSQSYGQAASRSGNGHQHLGLGTLGLFGYVGHTTEDEQRNAPDRDAVSHSYQAVGQLVSDYREEDEEAGEQTHRQAYGHTIVCGLEIGVEGEGHQSKYDEPRIVESYVNAEDLAQPKRTTHITALATLKHGVLDVNSAPARMPQGCCSIADPQRFCERHPGTANQVISRNAYARMPPEDVPGSLSTPWQGFPPALSCDICHGAPITGSAA